MFEIALFYLFVLFFWVLIGYRALYREEEALFPKESHSIYA